MLISTISFEIRDFSTGEFEQFLVLNTIENQEMVFTHRFTRQIKIADMFEFQFNREMHMPIEFIDPRILCGIANSLAPVAELELAA